MKKKAKNAAEAITVRFNPSPAILEVQTFLVKIFFPRPQAHPKDSLFWNSAKIAFSRLWCHSSSHHQKCIAEIGRPILALFLIPLVKMILLVVQIKLSDGFLIGSKLGEL
jgi:hypothetical protein